MFLLDQTPLQLIAVPNPSKESVSESVCLLSLLFDLLLTQLTVAPSSLNCSLGAVPSPSSSPSASASSACGCFGMYSSHLSFSSLMTFSGHEMFLEVSFCLHFYKQRIYDICLSSSGCTNLLRKWGRM